MRCCVCAWVAKQRRNCSFSVICIASARKIQLNLTQIIRPLPGQAAQVLHRDRFSWGKYLPRAVEPQLDTIRALTEFTAENGATRVVPGSHQWGWERNARDDEGTQAVMPRGSVLFYTGSVIHSGGENRSSAGRIAKNLAPELRTLLGYTMANYGLGYYAPPVFVPGTPGTMPPEMAFASGESFDRGRADVPEARTF